MKLHALSIALLTAAFHLSAAEPALPDAVKQIEKQGVKIIKPFNAPGGVKGWLGEYQGTGVTVYLTPDGQHAISGYMYDGNGNNLSATLINQEIYIPAGQAMWKKLAVMPAIYDGKDNAACKVVVFADPFCPYCRTFSQQIQSAVANGQIKMQTLLVGVLKPESGRYAAAILSAKDRAAAWKTFERSNGQTIPPVPTSTPLTIFHEIQANQQRMDELGANGTPAIYYLNRQQHLQQIIGMPDSKQLADLIACQ